ncbi:mono/diheme cytochrome c family protein [Sphingopyxis panaciterrae]|uniref:cytochrome c n=1 Tax=Sphingopyxis panaciterrae TaxID=363841 RepID=UPI0014211070|nr:cytochrome c [Sphingopyxis panaciterrae]NIJ37501.1 mono/diheme cytochrome c family protein [Sphingopyxis panaciterrae]
MLLLALSACQPGETVEFADASIELPEDVVAFPVRAGSDAMIRNCSACHSPSMVLNQPKLKPDQWAGIIKKMKDVYKAPINRADEPAIQSYLKATSAPLR